MFPKSSLNAQTLGCYLMVKVNLELAHKCVLLGLQRADIKKKGFHVKIWISDSLEIWKTWQNSPAFLPGISQLDFWKVSVLGWTQVPQFTTLFPSSFHSFASASLD